MVQRGRLGSYLIVAPIPPPEHVLPVESPSSVYWYEYPTGVVWAIHHKWKRWDILTSSLRSMVTDKEEIPARYNGRYPRDTLIGQLHELMELFDEMELTELTELSNGS